MATSSSWVGGDAEGAQQPVADDVRGAGGAGEGALQGLDAVVDVLVAALDQAVGIEDGAAAGAERDGAGGVQPAAGAQGRAGRLGGAADRAVRVADEDGQMAGGGVDQAAFVRVVDGVDAGGDLAGVDLGGQAVEELQDLVGRQVEAGVGAYGGAQLAHDGGGAHPAAHDVADDQGRAAGAEGDDVVPVAADGRVGAARLVGGGHPEVVGLFQLLGQQGALEGDRGLALAGLAGPQPLGGLDLVGDVGAEDEDAVVRGDAGDLGVGGRTAGGDLDGGAGEGVVAVAGAVLARAARDRRDLTVRGLPLRRTWSISGSRPEFVEFGQGFAGRVAGGAGAEDGGVGAVDVGDAVLGAVDDGDQGGDGAEDVVDGQRVDGRRQGHGGGHLGGDRFGVLRASRGDGAGVRGEGGRCRAPPPGAWWAVPAGAADVGAAGAADAGGVARSDRAAARRCVPGSLALQRVKITEVYLLLRVVARARAVGMGEPPGRRRGECRLGALSAPSGGMQQTSRILVIVTLCRYEPTHGHTSSVADRTDIRQTPWTGVQLHAIARSAAPAPGGTPTLLVGRGRQLASLWRPVPAASSNSARGFSSEPSETISRLNRPARVHSASTRALRLKVGTRLRW